MKKRKTVASGYFPAFLNIRRKKCLVVGGGGVSLRKVNTLVSCGADVTVISSRVHQDLMQLAKKKIIRVIRRDYEPGDLEGAFVVVAATDDKKMNRNIAEDAKKIQALVNVVDDPGPSDFIVPSVLRRGDLIFAISTGGRSPALSRKLRTRLEKTFGEEYGPLVTLVGEIRSSLKQKKITIDAETWQDALQVGVILKLLTTGKRKKAKDFITGRLTKEKT
jgi:precorrin-2 dehydrogenase/sirohydrochlorin ferrochelatase